MKVFNLIREQWLPRSPSEVFPFFADHRNLSVITPPWLSFEALERGPVTMRRGLRLQYRMRLHGFPLRWESEITAWDPPHRFVDEQRHGPYRLWIHEHTFRDKDGGTLAGDHVRYALPGGAFLQRLFVARDLERIFDFRRRELERIFGRDERGENPARIMGKCC